MQRWLYKLSSHNFSRHRYRVKIKAWTFSKKQPTKARSSDKSQKKRVMTHTIDEIMWLWNLYKKGFVSRESFTMYCDNQVMVHIITLQSKLQVIPFLTKKQTCIDFYFVCQAVMSEQVITTCTPSSKLCRYFYKSVQTINGSRNFVKMGMLASTIRWKMLEYLCRFGSHAIVYIIFLSFHILLSFI